MAKLKFFNPTTEQWEVISASSGGGVTIPIFHREVITLATNNIDISATGYNQNKDTLLVFQNSVFISKDEEYTISGTTITKTDGNWEIDDIIDFVVFKTVEENPDLLYTGSITEKYTAVANEVTNIPFTISYSSVTDKMKVYHKGVLLEEDVNYSLNINSTSIDLINWSVDIGEEIVFEVWKKITNTDNLVSGSQLNNLSIEKVKLSQGLQDDIDKIAILDNEIGDLSLLTTEAKNNLVAAVNEIKSTSGFGNIDGGRADTNYGAAEIIDAGGAS